MNLLKKNKDLLIFSISSLSYSLFQMLFGLVVLKWITPAEMGLWNGVTILAPYISFLQLGVFIALNRELPFLIGKGDKDRAIRQVKTAAVYANLISLIILVITIITLLNFYFEERNILYLLVILSFGLSIALQIKQNFLVVTFRSSNDFKKLGYIYLAVIPVYFLSILLVYFYTFKGFLAHQVISPFILVILLNLFKPYNVKSQFFKVSFKELLKTGIPFFSLNSLYGIAPSFKKIIILKYLGFTALGLFSPALAILVIGRMLPKVLGTFIYPKMSRIFGESGSKLQIWKVNIKTTIFTTLLSIPVVIIIYLLLPLIFKYIFTEYDGALKVTKIILLSVIFIIPQMAYNGLNSVKAYKTMTIVVVLRLVIYWFVLLGFYNKTGNIEGIAWGIVSSDLIFSIVVLIATYYELVLKKTL